MTGILKVDTIQSSGGTTGLTIDSSGRVQKPVLPHVFFQGGSEANVTMGNGETFGSTADGQAAFLIGGTGLSSSQGGITYNSSTGKFTVPLDGVYNMFCQAYANEDGQTFRIAGHVNDSSLFLTHNALNNNSPSSRGTFAAQAVVKLNAGDTIHWIS